MRTLSKSKLIASRQCPKRLWLEVHRPELREDSSAAQARFAEGHQVGEIAQRLYDPNGTGTEVDRDDEAFRDAFDRTRELLESRRPIFEAGFRAEGAMAFADVLLPVRRGGKPAWRMVEVKSSTSVKDYHADDVAVQAFVARRSGVPLASVSVAHIDSGWVYPGNGDYAGLLVESDQTEGAFGREGEVRQWIDDAQRVVAKRTEPRIGTGPHCHAPFGCPFFAYCRSKEPQPEHPIDVLPGRRSNALQAHIEAHGPTELREVPDELLNLRQLRVKTVTLSGKTFHDRDGALQALAGHRLPARFLDFETVQFAVPIWKGTRPYQQIPFQFSAHRLSRTGKLTHESFLDLSGKDPSLSFARALIAACGERGPIFTYNAGFEGARIRELAERFPRLARPLLAIDARLVDLLPVAREHYYHPSQEGSWSIKAVLPALCPDLDYGALEGVQDGGMAMEAYREALSPDTSAAEREVIRRQLLEYCRLDTYALVRLWRIFSGSPMEV